MTEKLTVIEKTFLRALKELVTTPKLARKYLSDHRITQTEKTIIRASMDLRDGKYNEVLESLLPIKSTSEVVESQRFFYIASAYNNLCHYSHAIEFFKKSLEIGKGYEIGFRKFSTTYYLIICYLNLKDAEKVKEYVRRLQEIGSQNHKEAIDLLFARYYDFLIGEDFENAKKTIETISTQQSVMTEHQRHLLFIELFDLDIKRGDYQGANLALAEIRRMKKFYNPASYKFMRALLDHVMHEKEIYLYDDDFRDHPGLYAQMKVLILLRTGEIKEALKYWMKLMNESPEVYKENFIYRGDRCLFSLCLEKNLKGLSSESKIDKHKTKEENLLVLLEQARGPIPKERIFELIYGTQPESKTDLHRLATLVYEARKKTTKKIKTQKGCYILVA